MEKKIKHLELIQSVINRMANNSFFIKSWAVTLVAAILGLANKESNKSFIAVVCFPIVMFWILDAFFLHQEKLFRALYEDVRKREEENIDFSMHIKDYSCQKLTWAKSAFSPALFLFYLAMIVAAITAIFILF
jgi:monomeric isocitrate dehydrogenase